MKKIALKILVILVMLSLIICMSNINIVSAETTTDSVLSNIQGKADAWGKTGANRVSLLGVNILAMTNPIVVVFGVVQFIVIAYACIRILLTAFRIIQQDTINKAEAKKELTMDVVILFLAVAGPAIAKKIIEIIK